MKNIYDLLVIGGGPGAMNAAIFGKRNGLKTILVTKKLGGQLFNTNLINNYFGYFNLSGKELIEKFITHHNNFNKDPILNLTVTKLTKEEDLFISELSNGEKLISKTVVLATGGTPRKLGVKGEDKKGVSYSIVGNEKYYKGKDVVVVGGGNSALEAALDLSVFANSVHIIEISNKLTAEQIYKDRVFNTKDITYSLNSTIIEIKGNDTLESVVIKVGSNFKTLNISGVFVQTGNIPNSDLVRDLVDINEKLEVITNRVQETSLKGLFAVGDVTNYPYKISTTASSQGAVSALRAKDLINNKK